MPDTSRTSDDAPKVVVAMDKFKGTATAVQACESLCAGIDASQSDWSCRAIPLADGGDGTVDALLRAGWEELTVRCVDAQGQPTSAHVARLGDTAVIELASICGLSRWRGEIRPWQAHTVGVGQAMRAMIDAGVNRIAVGLGGSASTDGGSGALVGLGFELLDSDDRPVESGLAGLGSVKRIRLPADFEVLRSISWTVLVDVWSPLTGPEGAANRFGPQKGLLPSEIEIADTLLRQWDELLFRYSGLRVGSVAGTGAAGGVAAGLASLLGSTIESGFQFVAEHVGLRYALSRADAVVTGEGHLDISSLSGKVPGEVLRLAKELGIPAIVVVGDADAAVLSDPVLHERIILTLVQGSGDLAEAMSDPVRYLRGAGQKVGEILAQQRS